MIDKKEIFPIAVMGLAMVLVGLALNASGPESPIIPAFGDFSPDGDASMLLASVLAVCATGVQFAYDRSR